jgi:hypothetical protein
LSECIVQPFAILTVSRVGGIVVALPRSACLTLLHHGPAHVALDETTCTFTVCFRHAVQTAWDYVRALLPEESADLSLQLSVEARGVISGRSIGLPLTLALLGALLGDSLPENFYSTGLMYLADGWFAGRLLGNMQAKAQTLGFLACVKNRQTTLAIPYYRHMPLPDPVTRVRYVQLAHVAHAAAELFPRHAERVRARFRALSTLEHLPFEPSVKQAFRRSGVQTIVLEYDERAQEPEIRAGQKREGETVWVRYPGLPGGGTMVYRFEGERLVDKEQFGDREDAQVLSDWLSGPPTRRQSWSP